MKIIHIFLLTTALWAAATRTGRATTITWTNAASGNWNTAVNWNPQQVPGAGDHAIINIGTVTVPASATFAILDIGGGTIGGSLVVASNAVANWSGGVIGNASGTLTIAGTGVLNVNGSATKYLYGALTNAGTVNWTGSGQLYLYNNNSPTYSGAVYNQSGGLFDLQSEAPMTGAFGFEFFVNAGTFRKDAGTGSSTVAPAFRNTGLVTMASGTLVLNGGGTLDGQFTTASGTTINLATGNFTNSGTPVFSGSGQSLFTGANLVLLTNTVPGLAVNSGTVVLGPVFQGGSITNLTLTGATLAGNHVLTGSLNFNSGGIGGTLGGANGSLTVAGTGVLNMNGSATKYLYGALTNAGTVNWTGTGQLCLYNNNSITYAGAIYNLAGGLFDLQSDAPMTTIFGLEFFVNAGTFRKDAGTGTSTVAPAFRNTGLVTMDSGTLVLNGGGSLDGQFTTASGTTINLATGNFTNSGAPVFSGGGQSLFTGANLVLFTNPVPGLALNGGTVILGPVFQGGSITNLTLSGAILTGNHVLTGSLNLNGGGGVGGTLGGANGSLTVASTGVLNMSGSAIKYVYGALTNAGTVNWTGAGQLYVYNNNSSTYAGAIYNLAGGLFDLQSDATMTAVFGLEFINNAGTFRKDAGTGTSTINPKFSNNGLVEADKATINFVSSFTATNGEVRSGLNSLTDFGKIKFSGNAALGGTVGVNWLNGYVPALNNSFTIVSFDSHTGIYTNSDFPAAALWTTNYTATTFTVTVASINKLAFTTQPTGGVLTNTILPAFVVQVEHPAGDVAPSNGVAVTLSGSGLQGTLTQITDASGKATFNDISFSQAGTKTLLARAANLTPALSTPFKILPAFGLEYLSGKAQVELNSTNNFGALIIFASTNLATWTPLFTNQLATNSILFIDLASTNYPYRFYRVTQ
ncbi:MAG TPA: hypothetical protein VG347_08220 [Verrucomicrobiae bacterium]|nr:hypothetical protein [Verrucomicrobiae bacterium]